MPAPSARVALIVHLGTPGAREECVARILAFFGVPSTTVSVGSVESVAAADKGDPFAVIGSVDALAAGLASSQSGAVLRRAAAFYGYVGEDRHASLQAVAAVAGEGWNWAPHPAATGLVAITAKHPALTGPMSGLQATVPVNPGDSVFAPSQTGAWDSLMSVDGSPAFVRMILGNVPLYLCGSASIPDIDQEVDRNYYDVKTHFLSAVPLVMFVTAVFREVAWRPNELGACLIIDDPLLKPRYGFCDFTWLRDRMRERRFATSVAFIPWNWRRTSPGSSALFRTEPDLFSVSIHGCDHIAGEFGSRSIDALDRRARLAQSRMQRHRARTAIDHDPVMVFPQGVFSSECPAVLKRNDFIAAVNTEISPVDEGEAATRVRDVWDIAILRYGSFAIYTRRYERHGLENFAFDLLLGKPCFIVAHHDEFRDGAARLLQLIDRLSALNCSLRWRSPKDVIHRAYRVRQQESVQIQMYGSEILVRNAEDRAQLYDIEKRESDHSSVTLVRQGEAALQHTYRDDRLRFRCEVAPQSESLVTIQYVKAPAVSHPRRSAKYEVAVAARRILSEFRDEYVQKLYAVTGR